MIRSESLRLLALSMLMMLARPAWARSGEGELARASSEAQKADVIAAWAGNAWRNYPEVDFNSLRIGQDTAYYGMLLSDEYFEPVFGEPYLSLSDAEREQIRRLFGRLGRYRNEKFGGRYLLALSTALKAPAAPGQRPRGDQGVVADYFRLVPELNEKARRWHAAMSELESLPGNAESFWLVDEKLPLWERDLTGLWPDQLRQLAKAAARIKREAAGEVLNAMVDAAIAGTEPAGQGRGDPGRGEEDARRPTREPGQRPSGRGTPREEARERADEGRGRREAALRERARRDEARRAHRELEATSGPAPAQRVTGDPRYDRAIRLQYLLWEQQELLGLAPEQVQRAVRARIDDAMGQNLGALVAEQAEAIDNFGSGAQAILAGSRWYTDYVRDYLGVFDHPIVRQPLSRFEQRRSADLNAGRAEAVERIGRIRSEAELATAAEQYLAVATDRDTVAGKVILAAIEAQRPIAAWETEKQKYSPAELALMTRPGVVRVPDDYAPPTGREVELAFLRAMAFTGGELVGPHTAKVGHAPLQNVFFMFLHTQPFKILQTVPMDERGGYVCEFMVDFRAELPGSLLAPDDHSMGAVLLRQLAAMVENEMPARMVAWFVMEPSGWQSPTVRAASFEAMLRQDANIADFARQVTTGVWP